MDQVRGRFSLGGISKPGRCQREGEKGHLSYAGKNGGASYLSTLICLTLGAHSIETESPSTGSICLARISYLGWKYSLVKTHRQLSHKHLKTVRDIEISLPQGKSQVPGGPALSHKIAEVPARLCNMGHFPEGRRVPRTIPVQRVSGIKVSEKLHCF